MIKCVYLTTVWCTLWHWPLKYISVWRLTCDEIEISINANPKPFDNKLSERKTEFNQQFLCYCFLLLYVLLKIFVPNCSTVRLPVCLVLRNVLLPGADLSLLTPPHSLPCHARQRRRRRQDRTRARSSWLSGWHPHHSPPPSPSSFSFTSFTTSSLSFT